MKRGRTEKGRRIGGSRLLRFPPGAVLLALLFQLAPASAQVWRVQNSGTSNDLNKIFFVDSIHGWAVGGNGTIVRTTDGGALWQQQQSPDSVVSFGSTFFVDTLYGWAIGGRDVFVVTTDGGENWIKEDLPKSFLLRDLMFIDRDTGWLVGGQNTHGTILKTNDGGRSWEVIKDSLRGGSFYAIDFINRNEGWTVGFNGYENLDSSAIFHTTNAGASWVVQPSAHYGGLHSVSLYDSQVGWTAGPMAHTSWTTVLKTTDGGGHWFSSGPWYNISHPRDFYKTLESIGSSLVLIGSGSELSPNIYRSTDGGNAWKRDSIEQANLINSISCTDATHCWACGGSGRIWRYTPSLLGVDEERNAREVEPKVSIAVLQRRDVVEVTYSLHEPLSITTDLHDVLGKMLASKRSSMHGEGPQSCFFDVHEYPSGVYYILSAVGGRTYVNSITVAR